MQIKIHHFTADENWSYVLSTYDWPSRTSNRAESFARMFFPKFGADKIIDAYLDSDKSKLLAMKDEFVQLYKDNESKLHQYDDVLKQSAEKLQEIESGDFAKIVAGWGCEFPENLTVRACLGIGRTYNTEPGFEKITIGTSDMSSAKLILEVIIHEFIHVMINNEIILKYNVPHHVKEHIVDFIGWEYFGVTKQMCYPEREFVEKYITRDTVENDLPGTVQKMMKVYNMREKTKLINKINKADKGTKNDQIQKNR